MEQGVQIIGFIDLSKFNRPRIVVPTCHSCGGKLPRFGANHVMWTAKKEKVEICDSCQEEGERGYWEERMEEQMRYQTQLKTGW
jgi:hypothetical protein